MPPYAWTLKVASVSFRRVNCRRGPVIKAFFKTAFFVLTSFTLEARPIELDIDQNLTNLLKSDSDKDNKITVNDKVKVFHLRAQNGQPVRIKGQYFQSNLLQELSTAKVNKRKSIDITHINEPILDRLSRRIKTIYWDGLTRKMNRENIYKLLVDEKIKQPQTYFYIPIEDKTSWKEFKGLKNVIVRPAPKLVPKGEHGLLALKYDTPYVVPGGRFNEMYGWDSYFELLGLLHDGRLDLALGLVDNFVYEITHYGKILNANRSYYLMRSQPPFLTSMIREVLPKLPQNDETKEWLKVSLEAALKEYDTVWMGPDHLTPTGLSRYYAKTTEIPPEVEPGHFNIKNLKGKELEEFLTHDQAVRESGHDTTYRWHKNGKEAAADFVTVDLNSLLHKYEVDFAYLITKYFNGSLNGRSAKDFSKLAEKRRGLIKKYLWNDSGWFFDYDWVAKKQSTYESATALYPLWAHDSEDSTTKILSHKEAKLLVNNVLKALELPGGLVSTSLKSLKANGGVVGKRQWDYPNGWAPHQMLAWTGLRNYGHEQEAHRLARKWISMIAKNAYDYNGTIPEKYDVLKRSHEVFAEYGNVGTKFSYMTIEGFGWMNASFQLGLDLMTKKDRAEIEKEVSYKP